MGHLIRLRTTCPVPGHGAGWCEPSCEKDNRYDRPAEEREALAFEAVADGVTAYNGRNGLATTGG